MKRIIFSIVMFSAVMTAFAQDGAVLARLLQVDNSGEASLFTLTEDVPYTITHSKTPAPQFTINENGTALAHATFPETAVITPIEVKLKNIWFTNGTNSWAEVNKKKADASSTSAVYELKDQYITTEAPIGGEYLEIRNLYGTAIEVWFYQEINYLPAGTYDFSVTLAGYNNQGSATLYLYAEENEVVTKQALTFPEGGWATSALNYTSAGGTVKFGIYLDADSGHKLGNTNTQSPPVPGWKITNFQLVAAQ